MANAYRDQNSVPTLIASSNVDGFTPVRLYADPVTHRLLVDAASGSGITSINGDSTATQFLVVGTAGNDFNIADDDAGTHTFNLPSASGTARGVVTTGTQTFGGDKTFLGNISAANLSGTNTGDQNLFASIIVSGQTTVTANTTTTALTLVAGTGVTLTTDNTAKSVTITASGGGTGTVTTVSVVSANGLAGTVANATTTPAITLSTTITGLLKGDGTAISAASAGTDYVTASSTNTFTNKTYDTAGTGNSFSINGVAVTANTGTGAVARASSPTFVTPTLGAATATSINGLTITSSTGTLSITNGKTFAVTNSLTLSGTDSTVMTFPSSTDTVAGLGATQTYTGANTFGKLVNTVTAMAAQALDGTKGNIFTRTLASSETFTQSGFSTGQCFMVVVTNAAGGGDTVTWFSGITWVTTGGTAPVQAAGANAITTYGFQCTGSNTFLGYLIGTN